MQYALKNTHNPTKADIYKLYIYLKVFMCQSP